MIRRLRTVIRDEQGQAMVMVAIFMLGLVAVAGLITDGGMVFAQRRELQNAADAAAAAGAMQVDQATYRASNGATVTLDGSAARSAATSYLAIENVVDYDVNVSTTEVRVNVRRSAKTGFLRMLGISGVDIAARAAAEPRHGVAAGGR
jgi:Flp pilus assembly protein TadG